MSALLVVPATLLDSLLAHLQFNPLFHLAGNPLSFVRERVQVSIINTYNTILINAGVICTAIYLVFPFCLGNNLSRGATDSRSDIVSAEISAKLDILLMNVARIARAVMPGEKRLSIPKDMPKLPLENSEQLDKFESFLGKSDINLAATV